MKEKKIRIMDEADERFSKLLQDFGYPSKDARVLVFMLTNKETVSKEIEQATGLRQPEVSVGTKHLRKAGLIKTVPIQNQKKGRPFFKYTTVVDVEDLVKDIQKKLNEDYEKKKKDLKEMVEILKGQKETKSK